jgi:hypothetical protein
MRVLRLTVRRCGLRTMEAWGRILHAYNSRHPLHQVRIHYHRQPVPDLEELVRHSPQIDPRGFEVQFRCPDGDESEVDRLIGLLMEAAGPKGQHFLSDPDPNEWFVRGPEFTGAVVRPSSGPAVG